MMQLIGSLLYTGFGTNDQGQYFDDLWSFSLSSNNWVQLSNGQLSGRKGGMSFVQNNAIFYTTGINESNTRLNETWKFQAQSSVVAINDENVTIYPNPANNSITIDSPSLIEKIELYSTDGKLQLSTNEKTIITQKMNTGFYILHMLIGGKEVIRKVQILH